MERSEFEQLLHDLHLEGMKEQAHYDIGHYEKRGSKPFVSTKWRIMNQILNEYDRLIKIIETAGAA